MLLVNRAKLDRCSLNERRKNFIEAMKEKDQKKGGRHLKEEAGGFGLVSVQV